MKVTFIGATHEVTGSCTLLEVGGRYFLVDCGMEQGFNVFENVPLPVPPKSDRSGVSDACPCRPLRYAAQAL